jgi:hypothetical protein
VDGLFPDDVDLGALLLDDDDMTKVLIDTAATLPDDMAWIWALPRARGGMVPFCLIFLGFSTDIRNARHQSSSQISS